MDTPNLTLFQLNNPISFFYFFIFTLTQKIDMFRNDKWLK